MYHWLSGKLCPRTAAAVCASRNDAEGEIGLDQALERLLDVAGVLVLDHDEFEAVDRGDVFAPLEIVAADLHLLAGELVARHHDPLAGVVGIFRVRIAWR